MIIDIEDQAWVSLIRFKDTSKKVNNYYPMLGVTLSLHDLVICKEVRDNFLRLIESVKRHRENGIVDHINRNGQDNRRCNLRYVTHQQNMQNRGKKGTRNGKPTTSKFKGVIFDFGEKRKKLWRANWITPDRKLHTKRFLTENEAVEFRDAIIMELYPEHGFINKKEDS